MHAELLLFAYLEQGKLWLHSGHIIADQSAASDDFADEKDHHKFYADHRVYGGFLFKIRR